MPEEQRPGRDCGAGDHQDPDGAAGPPPAGESMREAVHRRMRELAEARDRDQARDRDEARDGNGAAGNRPPAPDGDPPA